MRMLEITAAVLEVCIKKEGKEFGAEFVMVSDVAPCSLARIELLQAPPDIAAEPEWMRLGNQAAALLSQHECEDICNGALFDDQRAIHVGFAELQFRIEQQPKLHRPRADAYRELRTRAVADRERRSSGSGDLDISRA